MALVSDEAPADGSTRQRVLDAARDEFLEVGYAQAKVQAIAARAGFTTGAIYRHFGGKAELLAEVIAASGMLAFQARTGDVQRAGAGGPALATLTTFLLAAPRRPIHGLLVEAFAATLHDHDVAAGTRERIEDIRALLVANIDAARDQGLVDDGLTTDALVELALTIVLGSIVTHGLDLASAPLEELEPVVQRFLASFRP